MAEAQSTRRPPRIIFPVILVAVVAFAGWQYIQSPSNSHSVTISGTVAATEIRIASQMGGRVKQVRVAEGENIQIGQDLIDIYSTSGANESLNSPINGVVLERLIQPSEIAAPGRTLMVIADLNVLALTVYVPESRYGQIMLGQSYPVTVDSFPGEVFYGKVSRIADKAEFTPRNVQTVQGRESTVFAIKLDLGSTGGKLKPGMPADVTFEVK